MCRARGRGVSVETYTNGLTHEQYPVGAGKAIGCFRPKQRPAVFPAYTITGAVTLGARYAGGQRLDIMDGLLFYVTCALMTLVSTDMILHLPQERLE